MHFKKNQAPPWSESDARSPLRPRGRHWLRIAVCLFAVAALAGAAHSGQQTGPGMPIRPADMPHPPNNDPPDANAQMKMRDQQTAKQNFEAANAERKKQIAEDSAKLLQLATDLKAEVDKTDKDTLSLNVIRKAEQIEKLAHGVKEKMKLTVGQG